VGRFRQRFGDRIAILHSALTDAERRDERARIASGEARVVVGARSAIFAPLRGLGLIVVDEEHDASYKQESDPRYDARTVAAKRASLEGAVAIFGSATPRPESWEKLERLQLGGRIAAPMPSVRVVDLRREAGYPLSAPLLAALRAIEEHGGNEPDIALARMVSHFVNLDPAALQEYMPYVHHIHAKFYEMTDEGSEYSIPYEEILPILAEGGFSGYLSSEYEGQRHTQDAFDVDSVEQVRRQQDLFARVLEATN